MFCSAAKVMENNFDNKGLNINTNDLSQLLVKNRQLWWMVMNFRVKTLIRHRACSLTHHALSCIFQASLYQRLFTEYEFVSTIPGCNLVSSHQIFRFNSTQSRVYTLTVTSTIINGVGIAKHNCFLGWVRDAWAENALWQHVRHCQTFNATCFQIWHQPTLNLVGYSLGFQAFQI